MSEKVYICQEKVRFGMVRQVFIWCVQKRKVRPLVLAEINKCKCCCAQVMEKSTNTLVCTSCGEVKTRWCAQVVEKSTNTLVCTGYGDSTNTLVCTS